MMFTSDPAFYATGGISKHFNEKGEVKDPFAVSESILDITNKRLPMLIAPGSVPAHKKGEKYIQIQHQDSVKVANNIVDILKLFDENIGDLTYEEVVRDKEKYIKKYPELKAYFEIESTDAQENTTLMEHIDILYKRNKISKEVYDIVKKKTEGRIQNEIDGVPIAKENILTKKEIKAISTPIILKIMKPVYAGLLFEEKFIRPTYIKSASLPLIHEMTVGKPIDKLRQLAERLEKQEGKHVRLSYQSANKVGSVSKPIKLFKDDGSFNEKYDITKFNSKTKNDVILTKEEIQEMEQSIYKEVLASSLILNKEDFKIQQESPDKTDTPHISLITQMAKIIFGEGVARNDLGKFNYNGEEITGEQLNHKYVKAITDYISHMKESILKEFNLDPIKINEKLIEFLNKKYKIKLFSDTSSSMFLQQLLKEVNNKIGEEAIEAIDAIDAIGKFINEENKEYVKNVQKLLEEKVIEEGLSLQDLEALDIENQDGTLNFKTPLWLLSNSPRIESLLNKIVNKKLAQIKIPGRKYTLASSNGMQRLKDIPQGLRDKIVYTKNFDGKLRGYRKGKKAQVFLSMRFTDNEGKQISFLTNKVIQIMNI